jgi:hypothetical protein
MIELIVKVKYTKKDSIMLLKPIINSGKEIINTGKELISEINENLRQKKIDDKINEEISIIKLIFIFFKKNKLKILNY